MIIAPDGLVGNPFLIQQLAEFSVNAWVVASPKGAKRIIGIFCVQAVFARGAQTTCCWWRLIHQIHVTLRAARKPWPVLRFALRAEHGETGVYYTKKYFHTYQPLRCYPVRYTPLFSVVCKIIRNWPQITLYKYFIGYLT